MVAMGAVLSACDSLTDFGDINTDPNRVKDATPESFLAPVIYTSTWDYMQYGHRLTNEFVQYSVHNSELNEFHRYVVPHTESNNIWSRFYRNLTDVVDMERRAEERGNPNYVAIAKIWKAFVFANLTDMFGPVPYHEALQADQGGTLQPSFDTQEEVYKQILKELEEANALFNFQRNIHAQHDILYGGNLQRWQRFANSLRLRLLLRVSNRAEMNAGAQIAQILGSPSTHPVITSNQEAAVLRYSGTRPNISPFSDWRPLEFNGNRRATARMVNTLQSLNDPRLQRFLMPAATGGWIGIPSGWADMPPTNSATYNNNLHRADQPAILLSYAEMEFIRAEAILRGWVAGDAGTHYRRGIEASMQFWGASVPAGYLDQPAVAWNGTLERLMEQKWIALFWSGMEGWHEYRRTGLPNLVAGPGARNDGIVPTRLRYPSTVQALNGANYDAGVQLLGGPDNLQTKVWWAR